MFCVQILNLAAVSQFWSHRLQFPASGCGELNWLQCDQKKSETTMFTIWRVIDENIQDENLYG